MNRRMTMLAIVTLFVITAAFLYMDVAHQAQQEASLLRQTRNQQYAEQVLTDAAP